MCVLLQGNSNESGNSQLASPFSKKRSPLLDSFRLRIRDNKSLKSGGKPSPLLSKDRRKLYEVSPGGAGTTDSGNTPEPDDSVTSESSDADQISNRSSLGSANVPRDLAELTTASV